MYATVLTARNGQSPARKQLSNYLAALAKESLTAEAELTPKPGLVDRRGSGSHHDLTLGLLRRSAAVLEPYFSQMASAAIGRVVDTSLREDLAVIGRAAERAMYKATSGSNTHKGAIWILGLLVAASAGTGDGNSQDIASVGGSIARLPDRAQPAIITHGDVVRSRYQAAGARGEAASNFPHVIELGVPTLRKQRAKGCSEEASRLDALLRIMTQLDDTCVLYRGGVEALDVVKSGAQNVLAAGGYASAHGRNQLRKLDRELIARHVSPGGSADLLAATIFLDALERQQCEVSTYKSAWEDRDGAA